MNRILLCFVIYLSQSILAQSAMHPIHISRTEINHDEKSQSLQLTIHIYIDDLEDDIVKSGRKKPKLLSNNELANADQILVEYLKEKLVISNSLGKILAFSWVGKEKSDDALALLCYLEIEGVRSVEGLKIKNDVLFNLYDDQINIIETSVSNRQKSTFYIKKIGDIRSLEF